MFILQTRILMQMGEHIELNSEDLKMQRRNTSIDRAQKVDEKNGLIWLWSLKCDSMFSLDDSKNLATVWVKDL